MIQTTLPRPQAGTHGLLRYWPLLAGIAFAVNVSLHLPAGAGMAPVLAASAVVYVGAAAMGRRAAWPVFVVTVVLITAGQLVDTPLGPTGLLLALGAVLAGAGLLRPATRRETQAQTLGLIGFGAIALLAAVTTPLLGGFVTALGLLAHAVWDWRHHRTGRVVASSFAQFCAALDYTLAAIVLSLTTLSAAS
ncbi:hypothetical protein [Georgenia subflava]|uniref:Uncharacterized protein n=1 Tax=Georgenia subflava TaxID=1622177 RepID=A0A6N7EP82_9MICO|nr:hypothetical protein [Georgenia subflava]MPV38335.1 hypothetical protein [Georgenia subflava]